MPLATRASLAAAALAAAALAPQAGASVTAADAAKELPVAGCAVVNDGTGDAQVGVVTGDTAPRLPNDPDLDIQAVTLRSTASALVAYVKVADLAAGPSTTDGHRFSVNFKFNNHVFAMSGSAYKNGTGPIRDGLAATGQAGRTTQLGVDSPGVIPSDVPPPDKGFKTSGLKVTFDQAANYVVFELPLADIAKYGGKPFSGVVTDVDARSTIDLYAIGTIADTTNAGNTQTTSPAVKWTVGDNKCFPTKLALAVAKFPATRTVTAKLTNAAGAAVAGQPVTFYLNGRKFGTATTGANGTAVLKNVKPGFAVKAVFDGAGYAPSQATTKV